MRQETKQLGPGFRGKVESWPSQTGQNLGFAGLPRQVEVLLDLASKVPAGIVRFLEKLPFRSGSCPTNNLLM